MSIKVEQAWEEFNDQLKYFILKRVPNEDVAEDILQEVFIKIHSQIETLRDHHRLQSWLYRVTRNAITDYYRSQKPMVELPEIPIQPESSGDEEVIYKLIPCLKTLVDSLPERYREALILTEYQGMTQREMAEKLGISLSAAKSRVQRGREKIRKVLLERCQFERDRSGKVMDYRVFPDQE